MKPDPTALPSGAITPATLKRWLHDGREIALLDVREYGQYGESHLFYGINIPYSRLELDVVRLVPNPRTRIAVYDEGMGDDVAMRACARLTALGYDAVSRLDGGIDAWRRAGLACFAGVNLPSKTFGELAEQVYHTPRIGALDLAQRLARKENMVVLDGRPYAEFTRMSIPQAMCCPNGELPLRIADIVTDPATTIVVNCAGRTRSIIGAQTLINLGISNPVYALENGTQGWYLADLPLDHGAGRCYPDQIAKENQTAQRQRARALAERFGVPIIGAAQLRTWRQDATRNTFLCDVRSPEEFETGTLAGALHTPGGQLIQATDQYVGVRGARLVLFDTDGARAPTVATWLFQMGWDVYVLDSGLDSGLNSGLNPGLISDMDADPGLPPTAIRAIDVDTAPVVDAAAVAAARAAGATLVDVSASTSYRSSHIDTAVWAIRPRLAALGIAPGTPVIVLAENVAVAQLAAAELRLSGVRDVRINAGPPAAWREAGLPLVSTPDQPANGDCIDYLFFVHDRHSGNKAAARQYLAWETDLIHQIDEQERAAFRLPEAGLPEAGAHASDD